MRIQDYFLKSVEIHNNQKLASLFISILIITTLIAVLVIINRLLFDNLNYLIGDITLITNSIIALILIKFLTYQKAVTYYLSSVPVTLFMYFCVTNLIFPQHHHPQLFTEFTLIATFHMFLVGIFSVSQRLKWSLFGLDYIVYIILLMHFIYIDPRYDIGPVTTAFVSNGLILIFASYFASFVTQLTTMALKSESDLKTTNEFKNRLFSIVSHDLRSPFITLQSRLRLIHDAKNSDERRTYLSESISSSNEIAGMLDNLLHWSKNQFQGSVVDPEKIDMKQISSDDAALYKFQADQKQIEFVCNTLPNIYAYADREMVNIVLRNLISNAIKYSKPSSKIIFDAIQTEDEIIFSVEDSGIGFSDEQLNRFSSNIVHSTSGTDHEKGSGIGLLLSKDLVQKNGGSFTIKQNEHGSSVVFTLPKYQEN